MKLTPFVSSLQLICLFIPLLMHDMTSHLDCLDITAPSSQSKLLGIRELARQCLDRSIKVAAIGCGGGGGSWSTVTVLLTNKQI